MVELGQLIAGPFAGKTLGDFGAQVIKVEPPGTGDPLRQWRVVQDDTSVWLIENFKPGTLEKWGMGYDALVARNPGLIMLRISGYGQGGNGQVLEVPSIVPKLSATPEAIRTLAPGLGERHPTRGIGNHRHPEKARLRLRVKKLTHPQFVPFCLMTFCERAGNIQPVLACGSPPVFRFPDSPRA